MPSYVSHTIMAREVYKKINNDRINLSYMLTYSLGGDLTKFAKCRYECHKTEKREVFFNSILTYLIKNNLDNDPEVLGTVYGHLCHYAFDDTLHPLIRKLSKECEPNKKNHGYIENYYDTYLVNKKYNLPLNKYNNKELFKGKLSKKISKMLNDAYYRTFKENNISKYYKFNIWLYKKIRILFFFPGITTINKITRYKRFLIKNKTKDLLNNKHKTEYIDLNGKKAKDDFDTLYKKSVEKAVKDIELFSKNLEKAKK